MSKKKSMKFTQKQQYQICVDYAESRNYSATARKFKTSDKTVKRIVQANPDMAKIAEQKTEANRKDISEYMAHQSDRVCSFIDRFLTRLNSDELNELDLDKAARVFGIVFDKFCRPAQEVNLRAEGVVVTLEGELKEWGE